MSAQEIDINSELADLRDTGIQTGIDTQNETNEAIDPESDKDYLNEDIYTPDVIYIKSQAVQTNDEPQDDISLKEKGRSDRQQLAEQYQVSDYSSDYDEEDVNEEPVQLQQIPRSQIMREMKEEGESVDNDYSNQPSENQLQQIPRSQIMREMKEEGENVDNDYSNQPSENQLQKECDGMNNQNDDENSYKLEQIPRNQIMIEMKEEGEISTVSSEIDTKKKLCELKRESKENLRQLKNDAKLDRIDSKNEYRRAKREAKRSKREAKREESINNQF